MASLLVPSAQQAKENIRFSPFGSVKVHIVVCTLHLGWSQQQQDRKSFLEDLGDPPPPPSADFSSSLSGTWS